MKLIDVKPLNESVADIKESIDCSADAVLEYFTSAFLTIRNNKDSYSEDGFAVIKRIYDGLRMDLKDDNIEEFHKSYEHYLAKYPDAAEELYDAAFEAAGLGPEATIEQFLDKCK